MTFTALEYFAAVAREKSITRAAKKLSITQQTLSSQIQNLEKELGCALFIRHVPLEMTYAGQKLLDYASTIHSTMESLNLDFNRMRGNNTGILRIGIAYTRGLVILPQILEAFKSQYPLYSVIISEGSNHHIKKDLYDENVQIVIGEIDEFSPGIQIIPLYKEKIIYAGAKALLQKDLPALANRQYDVLNNYPFLLSNIEDVAGRIGRLFLSKHSLRPSNTIEANNLSTLLALCVKGMGVCLCTEKLLKGLLTQQQLDSLFIGDIEEDSEFQISIGILKKNLPLEPLNCFVDLARALAPKE